MHCKLLLSPQAERLTRSNSRSHSLVLSIQPKPYFWADTPPDVRWEDSYTGYAHVSRLLRRRELRPSILLREPDEDLFGRDHSSGLSATLQRCDGTVLHVRSRNTRAVYLVLLQGRLQMMLIRDVFTGSRKFIGYLCQSFRPYTEKHLTVVDIHYSGQNSLLDIRRFRRLQVVCPLRRWRTGPSSPRCSELQTRTM